MLYVVPRSGGDDMKTKRGFTLVEMVVVIAIILIITGVTSLTIIEAVSTANSAKDITELHYSTDYEAARVQVDGLRSAGYGSSDAYTPGGPTSDPGGGGTTPTSTPTPTPTQTPPTPTSTPTPSPTPSGSIVVGNYTVPKITGMPTPYPGTSTKTEAGWGEYDFNAKFTIPSKPYPTYAAIYLPPGTVDVIEWYSCKLEYFDPVTNIAVISIAANNTGPAIRVDYGLKKVNWSDTRIFDIAQKT